MAREAYCPNCEDQQRTFSDKPWLGAVCLACGYTISK